ISSAIDGIRVCFNARFETCCLAPGGGASPSACPPIDRPSGDRLQGSVMAIASTRSSHYRSLFLLRVDARSTAQLICEICENLRMNQNPPMNQADPVFVVDSTSGFAWHAEASAK